MKGLFLLLSLGTAAAEVYDAVTINDSLDQFESIYITYENCAWSPFSNGDEANPCQVAEAGQDLWYLQLSECFRANAAYSLYGVKKGQEDVGCTKGTYLNSFFTTNGVDEFLQALEQAGVQFTSSGEEGGDQGLSSECVTEQAQQDDDQAQYQSDYTSNNRKIFEGSISSGLGCDQKQFAYKIYQGAYCSDRDEATVTDTLSSFNGDLENVQCTQIYSASQVNQDDANQNQEDMGLNLLDTSAVCNVRLYPDQCPDPFGTLRKTPT